MTIRGFAQRLVVYNYSHAVTFRMPMLVATFNFLDSNAVVVVVAVVRAVAGTGWSGRGFGGGNGWGFVAGTGWSGRGCGGSGNGGCVWGVWVVLAWLFGGGVGVGSSSLVGVLNLGSSGKLCRLR